jgi:hypothetical protein
MLERDTFVQQVLAVREVTRPQSTLTYAIVGGADRGLFGIDSATGSLSFKVSPDFEAPADADAIRQLPLGRPDCRHDRHIPVNPGNSAKLCGRPLPISLVWERCPS